MAQIFVGLMLSKSTKRSSWKKWLIQCLRQELYQMGTGQSHCSVRKQENAQRLIQPCPTISEATEYQKQKQTKNTFHLYESSRIGKTNRWEKIQNSSCLWGMEAGNTWKVAQGCFLGCLSQSTFGRGWVYAMVRTHWMVHSRHVHYSKRKNCKYWTLGNIQREDC